MVVIVFFEVLQTLSIENAALFACILWSIWKQRNNKMWNDIVDKECCVLECASSLLYDWKAAKNASDLKFSVIGSNNEQQQTSVVKLKKPSLGIVKCNIDTFVHAKTEWFEPKCDVHIGEALGLLSARHWVHELQLGPIDFELDSKKVVDNFNYSNHDNT